MSQAYELYDGTNANLYLLFPELDDDIDIVRFIYRQNIYDPGETSGWVRDRETFDFRLKKEISSQKGKTVNSQEKVKESSYQTDKQTDIPCSVTNTKEECKGEGVSEKLSYEKFTKKAIVSLRTPGYKGIHAKLSGFNEAFRKYFPGKNPVEITKKLAEDEKIVIRPVKGGVMLYLPEDAPAYKIGGDDTLKKMGL